MAARARPALAHALAWAANGLAVTASTADAVRHDGGALALALGTAAALAGAALGLLAAGRARPRSLALAAAALAVAALAAAGAGIMLALPLGVVPAALLGLAAGLELRAMHRAVALDPSLAPRVRPAPTLLAAALGTALAAALLPLWRRPPGVDPDLADAAQAVVPVVPVGFGPPILLLVAAGLHLIVLTLLASAPASTPMRATAPADAPPPTHGSPTHPHPLQPTVLGLLALAAAGCAGIAALRPALSAIGTDDPQPAWPAALTLGVGAVLGPPLARLAARLLATRAVAAVATLAGVAALAAPVARPGALDAVVGGVLGIALAASVALAELARRGDALPMQSLPAVLALAGAGGAALAALLLAAVPVADVVLGAAIACLIAALGAWAPSRARQAPQLLRPS